jgi:hypothetical protein
MTETLNPQDKMKEASPTSLSKQAQKRLEGLTESQTSEAFAIAGIIDREIQKSGTFRDKLTDYAHALRGVKSLMRSKVKPSFAICIRCALTRP